MKSPVHFLRKVALAEAVSYLVLLGIAMPLKYLFHQPLVVKIVGMLHGILFVVFCVALLRVLLEARWPFKRCLGIFIASFIPILPFFLDGRMKEWDRAEA
jgi:integral membrane protein